VGCVCVPLAIGASILRNLVQERLGESWYHVHFYINLLTVTLTSTEFFIAVAATKMEGDKHFQANTHSKAGLAIFILVIAQALAGYFRPTSAAPGSHGRAFPRASTFPNDEQTRKGSSLDEEWNTNPSVDDDVAREASTNDEEYIGNPTSFKDIETNHMGILSPNRWDGVAWACVVQLP